MVKLPNQSFPGSVHCWALDTLKLNFGVDSIKTSEVGFTKRVLKLIHSFFYKNVVFWVQPQNFLKIPKLSLKKILIF